MKKKDKTMSIYRNYILELFSLFFLLISSVSGVYAQEKLNVHLKDASVAQLAQEIQRQADYTFVYVENVVRDVKVNVDLTNANLNDVMSQALHDTGLMYRITDRHVVIGKVKSGSDGDNKPIKPTRTISGFIKDAESREILIGAVAYCLNTRQGAPSNEYGFFSLTLPDDAVTMHFSYLGYNSQTIALPDGGDVSLNVLMYSDNRIAEIEVKADRPETGNASTRTGSETVPVSYINHLPCLFSEPDVMRALQTMPGVQKGISGTSGIFVRGGGQEQNLFLLDGVSLYNVDHLFGFMSAFMPDAVKNVDFYKSAFPSRYGGRLSSVVDVRTKDGDMQSYHGTLSVGLLSSHASLEGPIKKNKTSFSIAARRSYVDGLFALVSKVANDADVNALRPSFYDVNVKLNHIFSDADRLFASFYVGKDSYRYKFQDRNKQSTLVWSDDGFTWEENSNNYYSDKYYIRTKAYMKARWGNMQGALRWNHVYSPRLFANTTVAYNKFHFYDKQSRREDTWVEGDFKSREEYESQYESGITDLTFIHDLDYRPLPDHHVRMGAQYVLHRFLPEVTEGSTSTMVDGDDVDSSSQFNTNGEKTTGHDVSLYAEDDMSITDLFQMIVGARASLFAVKNKVYPAFEPRVAASYQLAPEWRIKASYAMMHQYVHLLSTMPISLPTDMWVPVSKNIKPMSSNQISMGAYSDAVPTFKLSVELYYKWLNNILDFKDGAFFGGGSTGWQRLVESGIGRSRGIELSAKRTEGSITGQVSYTLSKTDQKYGKDLNAGQWFPFRYDRRHVLCIVSQWQVNDRVDLGAQWNFASGACMSVPDKLIKLELPAPNDGNFYDIDNTAVCSSRNNYRLASTHSLDLSVNFHKQLKRVSRTLSISVMNVYARHNQDIVFAEQEGHCAREDGTLRPSGDEMLPTDVSAKKTVLFQSTIIPILPSVSYSIKF